MADSTKCPHCLVTVHTTPKRQHIGQFKGGHWIVEVRECPSCTRPIVYLGYGQTWLGGPPIIETTQLFMTYPVGSGRAPIPPEVDDSNVVSDYTEACSVLPVSTKASAALSRRCLQHILREKAKVRPGDLYGEIQQVIDSGALPAHLTAGLDAVRQIGNFAAHPIKSTHSGDIVAVEPGEAEWNLDVLEGLLDFYFVQPAQLAKKRAALDVKLKAIGKPPLR